MDLIVLPKIPDMLPECIPKYELEAEHLETGEQTSKHTLGTMQIILRGFETFTISVNHQI